MEGTAPPTGLWRLGVGDSLHHKHIGFPSRENTVPDVQEVELSSVGAAGSNSQLWISRSLPLGLALKADVRWKPTIGHFIVNGRV